MITDVLVKLIGSEVASHVGLLKNCENLGKLCMNFGRMTSCPRLFWARKATNRATCFHNNPELVGGALRVPRLSFPCYEAAVLRPAL